MKAIALVVLLTSGCALELERHCKFKCENCAAIEMECRGGITTPGPTP